MGILENIGKNIENARKELDNLNSQIEEKEYLKIETMGESPPIMTHRDFIYTEKTSKEEMVDMKESSDPYKILRRDSIVATNQRLSRIAKIILENKKDTGLRNYRDNG